jgi:hypothetical protein
MAKHCKYSLYLVSIVLMLTFGCVTIFCPEMYAQSKSINQNCVFYNSFAYIVETIEIPFKQGENDYTITRVPGSIIQESVFIESPSNDVQILRYRFDNRVFDYGSFLETQRGDTIYIRLQNEAQITGLFYDVKGSDFIIRPGNTLISINKNLIAQYYFKSVLQVDRFVPVLILTASSQRQNVGTIRLHYFLNNVSWKGEYTAFYNREQKTLLFNMRAHLTNNSGSVLTSNAITLIAGEPHRAQQEGGFGFQPRIAAKAQAIEQAPVFQIAEADIFYKFSLQQPLNLNNQSDMQIRLLPEISIPVQEKNIYDVSRYGNKIVNCLEFVNDTSLKSHSPLPAGIVRIYQTDASGSLFLGEDRIPNTPLNERVTIQLGTVFDLTGERTQTNFRRIGEKTTEETYTIELRNASSETKTVLVREHFYGEWRIIESTITFKKLDSRTAEFTVTVPPQEKASFTYTVRYN